jgi:hypothetical protein
MTTIAEVRTALDAARGKDQFVHSLNGVPLRTPIPAPIGANCPDHPTYPLVIKDGEAWCRRGQHLRL